MTKRAKGPSVWYSNIEPAHPPKKAIEKKRKVCERTERYLSGEIYRKRRAEGIESIRFLWDDDDEPDKKNIRNSPSSDLLFIQVQSSPVPMDKITNAVVVSVIFFCL